MGTTKVWWRARDTPLVVLAVLGLLTGVDLVPLCAQERRSTPIDQRIELGSSVGRYDGGLGSSDGQVLRYRVSQASNFALALSLGRQRRFGEAALGNGVSFTKSLPRRSSVSVGWNRGTGEILSPRYQLSLGARKVIPARMIVSAGYRRRQSKYENRSDAYSLGLVKYTGPWILEGHGRVSLGFPGDTVSSTAAFGVTWYRWKQIYVGGGVQWNDVSYQLVPRALREGLPVDQRDRHRLSVNYRGLGGNVRLTRWFNRVSGIKVRVSYGDNDFYRVGSVTVGVFRDF